MKEIRFAIRFYEMDNRLHEGLEVLTTETHITKRVICIVFRKNVR